MAVFNRRDIKQNHRIIIAYIHTGTFLVIQRRPDICDIHLKFVGDQSAFLQSRVHHIHPDSRSEVINFAKDIAIRDISSYHNPLSAS